MAEVKQVDVSTVANWLELGHAVVVDVRESHEYESGHIAESLHITNVGFRPVPDSDTVRRPAPGFPMCRRSALPNRRQSSAQ